jgi:uncharacterized protein YuzE
MKIAYHEDVDILTIIFRHETVKVSEEIIPGVVVDYDHEGQILAFEIFDASKFTDLPGVTIFMSQWGGADRVLDANGDYSILPRVVKAISAGD